MSMGNLGIALDETLTEAWNKAEKAAFTGEYCVIYLTASRHNALLSTPVFGTFWTYKTKTAKTPIWINCSMVGYNNSSSTIWSVNNAGYRTIHGKKLQFAVSHIAETLRFQVKLEVCKMSSHVHHLPTRSTHQCKAIKNRTIKGDSFIRTNYRFMTFCVLSRRWLIAVFDLIRANFAAEGNGPTRSLVVPLNRSCQCVPTVRNIHINTMQTAMIQCHNDKTIFIVLSSRVHSRSSEQKSASTR